jgi:hypothetical protein
MVMLVSMAISPLVRSTVEQEGVSAKLIVSPELALRTASRSEPPPESLQLVTVCVAALAT